MPYVDHARREIRLKLVYYGPGLGGKTTNVEWIHRNTRPSRRGKLVALTTESERTLFFDLLPVDLGEFKGYRVRCHLCTVPGQIAQVAVRRMVLAHVDAVVFVVDSQRPRLADNLASLRDLRANLASQGDAPDRMPWVVQYNKRDLANAMPVATLARELGFGAEVPQLRACATRGEGVFETLRAGLSAALQVVSDPAKVAAGRVDAAPRLDVGAPSAPPDPSEAPKPEGGRRRKSRVPRLRTGKALPAKRARAGRRRTA